MVGHCGADEGGICVDIVWRREARVCEGVMKLDMSIIRIGASEVEKPCDF